MKQLILTLLLAVLAGGVVAQSEHPETVRLHLLHRSNVCSFQLKTHLNPDKPVKLAPQSYTMLEFDETQLGIIQDINFAEQMVFFDFEKGKDYYFRISRNEDQAPVVQEMSANAFKLELLLGGIDIYPVKYRLATEVPLTN